MIPNGLKDSRSAPATAKRAVLALKVAVSGCLIALLLYKLDAQMILSHVRTLDGLVIASMLVVVLLQTCILAGLRLQFALQAIGTRLPFRATAQIALSGLFVEQVAFGFAGGDATRLLLLRRAQVPFSQSLAGLLSDRAIGLGSLLILSMIGIHEVFGLLAALDLGISIAAASVLAILLGVALVALLLHRQRLSAEVARLVHGIRAKVPPGRTWSCLAAVFALALTIHILNVLVMWLPARDMQLPLSLAQGLIIIPTVLLVSMLPIGTGGWGVREGMMVLVLGQLGIAAEQAIVPPLMFGTATLLATLPGSIVWAYTRNSHAAGARSVQDQAGCGECPTTKDGRI